MTTIASRQAKRPTRSSDPAEPDNVHLRAYLIKVRGLRRVQRGGEEESTRSTVKRESHLVDDA